jgi:hypothetical protein
MEMSAASCTAFSQVVLAGLFSLIVVIVVSLIVVKMVVGVGIVVSTMRSFIVSAIVLKFFSVARPFVVSTFVFFFVLFVVFKLTTGPTVLPWLVGIITGVRIERLKLQSQKRCRDVVLNLIFKFNL